MKLECISDDWTPPFLPPPTDATYNRLIPLSIKCIKSTNLLIQPEPEPKAEQPLAMVPPNLKRMLRNLQTNPPPHLKKKKKKMPSKTRKFNESQAEGSLVGIPARDAWEGSLRDPAKKSC